MRLVVVVVVVVVGVVEGWLGLTSELHQDRIRSYRHWEAWSQDIT